MEKNIWVSRLARIATRAPHMYCVQLYCKERCPGQHKNLRGPRFSLLSNALMSLSDTEHGAGIWNPAMPCGTWVAG